MLQNQISKTSLKRQSSNSSHFNATQEKLETFYEKKKTKGIIILARARWHEHGEKSTKYFLNLKKINHIKNVYTKISYKRSN